MCTLTSAQMQILQSAMPALVQRVLGLSGDELRKAMHPVWARTITDVLHQQDTCACQRGGVCFVDLSADEQDQFFKSVDDFSLDAFIRLYEEACRQALGDTPTP